MLHAKGYALPLLTRYSLFHGWLFFLYVFQSYWTNHLGHVVYVIANCTQYRIGFLPNPGFWIFPKLNLAGAGWSFLISWVVSDIAAFMFIATPRYELPTNIFRHVRFTEVGTEVFRVGFYVWTK